MLPAVCQKLATSKLIEILRISAEIQFQNLANLVTAVTAEKSQPTELWDLSGAN